MRSIAGGVALLLLCGCTDDGGSGAQTSGTTTSTTVARPRVAGLEVVEVNYDDLDLADDPALREFADTGARGTEWEEQDLSATDLDQDILDYLDRRLDVLPAPGTEPTLYTNGSHRVVRVEVVGDDRPFELHVLLREPDE